MKYNKNKKWLLIAEKYFDATTTYEEEKALKAFLATQESNTPEFNEIKAVLGYFATARNIANKQKTIKSKILTPRRIAAAASIAILMLIVATPHSTETKATKTKELYFANINGDIHTNKEFVLEHMHQTMAMIGNTTKGNSIEEQLGAMFSIANE